MSDIGSKPLSITTKWLPRLSDSAKAIVFQTSTTFDGDRTVVEDALVDRDTLVGQEILPDAPSAGFLLEKSSILYMAESKAACAVWISQYDPALASPTPPDREFHKMQAKKILDFAGGEISFPEVVLPAGHYITIVSGAANVVTLLMQQLTTWRV